MNNECYDCGLHLRQVARAISYSFDPADDLTWKEILEAIEVRGSVDWAMALGSAARRANHARESNPHPFVKLLPFEKDRLERWKQIHNKHDAWNDGWDIEDALIRVKE